MLNTERIKVRVIRRNSLVPGCW